MLDGVSLPSGLQNLTFGNEFNQPLDRVSLPSGLQSLTFGNKFNQRLDGVSLPSGLQSLRLGYRFNQIVEGVSLPSGLQNLTFGNEFNQRLDGVSLPSGLQCLTFGHRFNQTLEGVSLPSGLQNLTFGSEFNQRLHGVSLPSGLQSLTFGHGFNQTLDGVSLPSGLQSLSCGSVVASVLWFATFFTESFCRKGPRWFHPVGFRCSQTSLAPCQTPQTQITLLRVIPTLAFQVIYSDIYFDILPNILSDIYSDRRKFRSQTSDNMDRWKAEQGRGREKRKIRREKIRRERVRRKKMQMREKVGKSRNTVFFQWFEAPEGRKVGSLKRRVRSQLARWEMKIWRRCGAKQISKWKCTKHTMVGALLEAHAVVARSTFRSQNVKNTRGSDHFWRFRCRKSARRCGAKHVSKWKCAKHTSFGPLLEVEMSKKCTPLWREAHFEVKMWKTLGVRNTFGR